MTVITGNGTNYKNLDRLGAINVLRVAQQVGDKYAVIGAYSDGEAPDEIERAAGYTIGATSEECAAFLRRHYSNIGTLGGQSKSEAKQRASRENGKLGGRPPK